MNNDHLLAALEEHIKKSKEIIQNLELPRYEAGGAVGNAAVSEIARNLSLVGLEIIGLKSQLKYHSERSSA
jgi:hypothetical protein